MIEKSIECPQKWVSHIGETGAALKFTDHSMAAFGHFLPKVAAKIVIISGFQALSLRYFALDESFSVDALVLMLIFM